MVRHTDAADAESLPQYAAAIDLSAVEAGDTIDFKTNASLRDNGVTVSKTLTADTVDTVTETTTRMVEVDPAWFPDTGPFGSTDDVVSKTVPRETTQTKTTVVAIDDEPRKPYRYTLTQIDDDEVRVSSCRLEDFEDQQNGTWNAVARSNVSNGYVTDFAVVDDQPTLVTDGGHDVTEYDVDPDDDQPYDQITEGDAVDVVYVPNRGKAPSKTKSGVVTYVNRRDDGTVRSVNVDTGDEYDDGTPKTLQFDRYDKIVSHGRVRETTIGDVTRVVVRTYDDVDTDETDQREAVTDGGTSVDDFEAAKSDVADAVRATDDRALWEAFGHETQRRVSDVEVGRYAAVAYTLSVDAYAAGMDLSRCVVPAVVWGVTDKAYAYDRLGEVYDAVVVFHTGAAGPYVDGIRKKVADAIDPDVVVTEPIADPETVDDREPVTDGGTDVCDRCDDPSDDVRDVDVGGREHERVVDRGHTDPDTGERVGRDVRTQTEHFAFALCPTCRDETDQTEPPEHEAGAYTVTYRRDGVVETADFAGSAIVEHFETIDAVTVIDVTRNDETDQPALVTDGGRDVEAVTVYVIDGAHETTSASEAERARSNGRRVTAKSRLR